MARRRLSRRQVLSASAAAGMALLGHTHRATAQATIRIDRYSPELDAIIDVSEPVRELATGFGNADGNAEGPVWWKEGGYLLFSDIGNNRRKIGRAHV